MKFANYVLISSAVTDEDFESEVVALDQIIKASFQISVSAGTVTGSIQVQVSNDPPIKGDAYGVPAAAPQTWSNLGIRRDDHGGCRVPHSPARHVLPVDAGNLYRL